MNQVAKTSSGSTQNSVVIVVRISFCAVLEGTFHREANQAPSVRESSALAPLAFQGSPIGRRLTMRSSRQNAVPRLASASRLTFGMPRHRRFVPSRCMTVSPRSYCG